MNVECRVRKRDGSVADFDPRKIERSILNAARGAGQDNPQLARDLAAVVAAYVRERFREQAAPTRDLRSMVRQVLQDTGYPDVARAYEAFVKSAAAGDLFPQELLVVDAGTQDEVERWDRGRIRCALVRRDGVPEAQAAEIAEAVERAVLALRTPRVSTGLVREIVAQELWRRGLRGPTDRLQQALGVPKAELRQWLSPTAGMDPETVCLRLGEMALKQYALEEVFARDVADAHLEGRIHIHHLENPFKFYWGRVPWQALGEPLGPSDIRMNLARRHFGAALEVGAIPPGAVVGPSWERPRLVIDSVEPPPDLPSILWNVPLSRRDPSPPPAALHRALQRGQVLFAFERGSRFGGEEPWIIGQAVSLNLPRVGLRSAKIFDDLEATVELAVRAHLCKRELLAAFLLNGLAPTLRRPGAPPMRFSIGVQGLDDLLRRAFAENSEERAAVQLLSFVHGLVREAALRHGLNVALDDLLSSAAVERFARCDARLHPGSRSSADGYTSGFHAAAADRPDLATRLAVEARRGALVDSSVVLIPREWRPQLSAETLSDFIRTAARDSRVRRVLIL